MSLNDYINQTIKNEIENLLETLDRLNEKDNIEQLKQIYIPDIDYKKKHTNKFIVTKKHTSNERCTARCWGGANPVEYNLKTQKWIYGKQCKKNSVINGYCTLHDKLSVRSWGLTNGDFFEDPPHKHYDKYKNKIEKNLTFVNNV